jgi:peptidyl-prolyl cis-trans isomerase SurA
MWHLLSCCLALCGLSAVQAQTPPVARSADYIVAVVNSEPITNNEVQQQRSRVLAQWPAGAPKPSAAELSAQALEQLINEKAQLQQAREAGIRIEDDAVDMAENNLAMQNQMDRAQLRAKLVQDGLSLNAFREQLRIQLTLNRLREREVDARVRVSDAEIDEFLKEQRAANAPGEVDLNLAMILVPVPEDSNDAQVTMLQSRAATAASRARGGEDFAKLVGEFMGASVANGGAMGLRPASRYPSLFVDNLQSAKVGDVVGPLRSGAGFHVLKVLEKRQDAPGMVITQTRARHILLRSSAQLTSAQAQTQLAQLKQKITSGQTTFAAAARELSQDGSAMSGGDLGWASPGQFVPEFEQVMNRLRPNQMSDPLVSRFGVHLIEVTDRREVPVSERDQREMARGQLREKKLEESYSTWQEGVRGRAFVEMRDAPQ